MVNGKRSPFFDLPGGGRQGDNLYPLIQVTVFVIVVQGLAFLISTYPIVDIPDKSGIHRKLGQYADDTTLFIGDEADWTLFEQSISIFCDASGMRMNWGKSVGMWLGSNVTGPPKQPLTCAGTERCGINL